MDPQAFSVALFCKYHGISPAKFYQLLKGGTAPTSFLVGRRRLISMEAAARWRAAMEARAAVGQA